MPISHKLRAAFLSQLLCQLVAKLSFPWWWLISSPTWQGERYFTAVTIKQVFSSFHRQAPRAKKLARHMIATARLLAAGVVVLLVNSSLEQMLGLQYVIKMLTEISARLVSFRRELTRKATICSLYFSSLFWRGKGSSTVFGSLP